MKANVFLLAVGLSILTTSTNRNAIGAAEHPESTPVLWSDPGRIGERDLYWGPGSAAEAPLPPFRFVKEDTGGTKPKVHVIDAREVEWSVKFAGPSPSGNEVHAEVAASRLTWALGYLVEESYYVAEGRIVGASQLRRAATAISPDGSFRTARFERRPKNIVRTGRTWTFDKNPFLGTKELTGAKILATLLGNWDASESNTAVLQVTLPGGGLADWYVQSDLGSTFGKMGLPGSLFKHNRWNAQDYRKQPLIDWVEDDTVRLNYQGAAAIRQVRLDHAQWFALQAVKLTPDQIKQAFRAAGAKDAEVEDFSAALLGKIAELHTKVVEKTP